MTTLFMEWAGDLVIAQNGGLVLATGWDEIRQRVERRCLTNPQFYLPDGTPVAADYIWDVNYGVGLRRLIGQPYTPQLIAQIRQKALQGTTVDAGIDTSIPPIVTTKQGTPGTIYLIISVKLTTGQPGKVAFQIQ